jgi:CBS domain-containing membrane protein
MTKHANEIRVADLMTRRVYTLTPMQSLPLAESMMGLLHVRHIPVVDAERRVVGIVTHRDLLQAKISSLAPLSDDERAELQLSVPVSRVMRTNVWTIAPQALAVSAARIMREHKMGCLPVVHDGRLVGIVTEADLLALVTDSLELDRPAQPWTMERVMTRVPVTITPDATLAEARAAMSRYGIHHLPVVENGRPIAMVCERDLTVAETIFEKSHETRAAYVVRLLAGRRLHTAALDAPVDVVLADILREHVDAVAVVDGDRVAGIFTATDACRMLAEALRPSPGSQEGAAFHDRAMVETAS